MHQQSEGVLGTFSKQQTGTSHSYCGYVGSVYEGYQIIQLKFAGDILFNYPRLLEKYFASGFYRAAKFKILPAIKKNYNNIFQSYNICEHFENQQFVL